MGPPDDEVRVPEGAAPLTMAEVLERIEADRQRVAKAAAAEDERRRLQAEIDRDEAVAAMTAAAERARQQAMTLPCFAGMAKEPPDVHSAVDECVQTTARQSCPRWAHPADPRCPIRIERKTLEELAEHLFECRIPGSIDSDGGNRLLRMLRDCTPMAASENPPPAELLMAARRGLRGRGWIQQAPRPLRETGPVQLVRAFMAREPRELVVEGRRFNLRGDEWCLIMGGEPATGKTVGMCAPAADERVLFVAAPELVGYKPRVEMERAESAAKLALDDLGTERNTASGAAADDLAGLLELRHRHRRLTLVTANVSLEDMKDRYGKRLFDKERGRMLEGMVLAGFKGESLR